ncbi:MAG: hypothetical protein J0H68_04185 [Sphingobacteriia bacterium]|nr:hypothetical protein [Sphingobacteriia bacterium]
MKTRLSKIKLPEDLEQKKEIQAILNILDALEYINPTIEAGKEKFSSDINSKATTVLALQIIGENIKILPHNWVKYTDKSWYKDFRNRSAHTINMSELLSNSDNLWNTITSAHADLSILIKSLCKELKTTGILPEDTYKSIYPVQTVPEPEVSKSSTLQPEENTECKTEGVIVKTNLKNSKQSSQNSNRDKKTLKAKRKSENQSINLKELTEDELLKVCQEEVKQQTISLNINKNFYNLLFNAIIEGKLKNLEFLVKKNPDLFNTIYTFNGKIVKDDNSLKLVVKHSQHQSSILYFPSERFTYEKEFIINFSILELAISVSNPSLEIINFLLDKKVSLSIQNSYLYTLLHLVNNVDVLNLLLTHPYSKDVLLPKISDENNIMYSSPLRLAVEKNNIVLFNAFLNHGAKLSFQSKIIDEVIFYSDVLKVMTKNVKLTIEMLKHIVSYNNIDNLLKMQFVVPKKALTYSNNTGITHTKNSIITLEDLMNEPEKVPTYISGELNEKMVFTQGLLICKSFYILYKANFFSYFEQSNFEGLKLNLINPNANLTEKQTHDFLSRMKSFTIRKPWEKLTKEIYSDANYEALLSIFSLKSQIKYSIFNALLLMNPDKKFIQRFLGRLISDLLNIKRDDNTAKEIADLLILGGKYKCLPLINFNSEELDVIPYLKKTNENKLIDEISIIFEQKGLGERFKFVKPSSSDATFHNLEWRMYHKEKHDTYKER